MATAFSQKVSSAWDAASQVFFTCCMRAPAAMASHRGICIRLGNSYSNWWEADLHLPRDKAQFTKHRSSFVLSSCPLWVETTHTRKYTWQKGEATCRYWTLLSQLAYFSCHRTIAGLPCPLCCQEKIGDPHQQWMLPHFLERLFDHYSLCNTRSIYCSLSMTT